MKQKRDYGAYFDKIWREPCEKASESGIELSSDERTSGQIVEERGGTAFP